MRDRVRFEHLERLSDDRGLFEHAEGTERREEHGYCTDDNARLLVVTSRDSTSPIAERLSHVALGFVLASQDSNGRNRNRMDVGGNWLDVGTTDDCWGRALWGLGVAAAFHDDPGMRLRARKGFNHGARQRSPWPRAMAFASIGAAALLTDVPDHELASRLLHDTIGVIGRANADDTGDWTWPEPRLRYGNAVLAEALIAAGDALDREDVMQHGLDMLRWLLSVETSEAGNLSVTGTEGRGPLERQPQFDQQSIEVAAIADACSRAFAVTSDAAWLVGLHAAVDWFEGANDVGLAMFDAASGGGFDGLHADRVNSNQGAESTLAYVSTMQHATHAANAPVLR